MHFLFKLSTFWYTKDTFRAEFGEDQQFFSMFDLTHCLWLLAALILCVGGGWLYHRLNDQNRRRMLVVLTVLLLVDEVIKYAFTIPTGQFVWQYLPFHLCSINIFVCLWHTLRPGKLSANILYAVCLPGALAATLLPSWTILPVWNMMHLHSASIHILLVLYPILLLSGGLRPDFRQLPKVLLFMVAACIPAYILNTLTGTNFMFLSHTENNPALELIAALFGRAYPLGLLVAVVIVWVVMYAPWALAELFCARRRRA